MSPAKKSKARSTTEAAFEGESEAKCVAAGVCAKKHVVSFD